ncbi:hypothetical protein [Streptomyces sp900129855]|uniref:Uncharacterized protein n=1 Tax=Streptomyces sp. 900129855 TaxID=3155129 RepID=A0ABV2ZYS3_9ACTN
MAPRPRPQPASARRSPGIGRPDAQPPQTRHGSVLRFARALTALPVDFRTGLVRHRALDLYEAIPAQHHRERAVRELRDMLSA